ncbi:unnamed protein product [Bemisia tabaci]|uniref:Uncharacterized protein n=1 Tax=Bemisia tabaci TaxID=7038 RepID=A0A9P0A2V7_BEMTA|nr:unnamed protein product [Bemisia tabaci]
MRKLRRGYARFAELRDSHRLEPGSVLYSPSVGRILVLDNAEIAVMENNLCPFQPTFRLHIFSDSEPGSRYAQEEISPEVRLMRMALARRLSKEDLPYHMIFCNKSHWWAFILHGRRHESWWKTTCPLARSWVGVNRGSVESGAFAFQDRCGNEYHGFPSYDRELDDRTNFSWIPGRRLRNIPLPKCFMAPLE